MTSNAIERVTKFDLANKTLNKLVSQIERAALNVQTQAFKVAFIVAQIKRDELWKDDFESFEQFGQKMLGCNKSTLYNQVKLGENWVTREGHTIFYDGNMDFTKSQLYQIMRIKAPKNCGYTVVEKATEFVNKGIITPYMTVEQIKDEVDNHNAQFAKPKKEVTENEDEKKPNGKAEVTSVATVKHALEFLESEDGVRMVSFEGETCRLTNDQYVEVLAWVAQIMGKYDKVATVDAVVE